MADDDRTPRVGDEPVGGAPVTVATAAPASLAERVPPMLVFRWAVAGASAVVLVALVAYGLYIVRGILVLVLIALFLAVSLDPAVRSLETRGVRRSYAVTIVILLGVALFAAFIWSVVPPMIEQGSNLFADLPGYLQRLSNESSTVRDISERYDLTERLTALANDLPDKLAGGAVGFAQRLLGALGSLITVLALTIYFMADLPRIQRGLVRLFPHRRRPRVSEVVDVVVDKVGGYMSGNVIISVFAGVATFACMELVGVPFALPLAVTVALTDLIPMVGATLGATICVIVSVFTVGIWPESVIVLLFFIVYQQVENYVLAPRVLRNTVDMSSVAVLLAALIGGTMLGLVGAVMAIPIAAALKVLMSQRIATMYDPPAEEPPNPDRREAVSVDRAAAADPPQADPVAGRSSDGSSRHRPG